MLIIAALSAAILALLTSALAYSFGLRLADRLPGESHWPECLYCQRKAEWYEVLPIIGWLKPRLATALPCPCGRRRNNWQRPAVEIAALLLGGVAGAMVGLSAQLPWVAIVVGLLLAIALVDAQFGIIPDTLNFLVALCGFFWLLCGGRELSLGIISSGSLLLLGLLLALVYSKLRGREMLGLGDVKYFAAVGLWLAPTSLPYFLILSGVLGAISGMIWQRVTGEEQTPFAPALVVATLVYLFLDLGKLAL